MADNVAQRKLIHDILEAEACCTWGAQKGFVHGLEDRPALGRTAINLRIMELAACAVDRDDLAVVTCCGVGMPCNAAGPRVADAAKE